MILTTGSRGQERGKALKMLIVSSIELNILDSEMVFKPI